MIADRRINVVLVAAGIAAASLALACGPKDTKPPLTPDSDTPAMGEDGGIDTPATPSPTTPPAPK